MDNDDSTKEHNDNSNDEEGEESVLLLEETLNFVLKNQKNWILLLRQNIGKIVTKNISANVVVIKNKKKLSAVEKATLCYDVSQIINLSAHMKS